MKNLICGMLIAIPQIFLLPTMANADVSVSSDAGRSIENGQSDTIKRDKSLSTDKSQGNKASDSDSREKAKEESASHSKSKKTTKSVSAVKSYSIDVNINGLLLRQFTARYERDGTGYGMAGKYFWVCKPLTRAIADYPVIYKDQIVGRNEAQEIQKRSGFTTTWVNSLAIPFNHNDPTFSRYVQCRVTASYWIAEAGDRAASQKIHTEDEVSDKIKQVFTEMDADDSIFQNLRQRARDLWGQETCSERLQQEPEFKSPEIQCGIFSYVGNTFTVENRETLSESSINGHSYKIAVITSAGDTLADEDATSSDDKVSSTKRKSQSTERFNESKKTASLNKSKSLDQNSSNKVDRSTGNSVNAAPKE
jgi:hypothetical protein